MIGCLTETTTCVVAKPLVVINAFGAKIYLILNFLNGMKKSTSMIANCPFKKIIIIRNRFLSKCQKVSETENHPRGKQPESKWQLLPCIWVRGRPGSCTFLRDIGLNILNKERKDAL